MASCPTRFCANSLKISVFCSCERALSRRLKSALTSSCCLVKSVVADSGASSSDAPPWNIRDAAAFSPATAARVALRLALFFFGVALLRDLLELRFIEIPR